MNPDSNRSNRRDFLRFAAAAGALALRPSFAAPSSPPANWSKRSVVLRSEDLPGGGLVQNFTSPAEPLDDGRWRLWLSASGKVPFNLGFAEGRPGEKMAVHMAELSPGDPPDASLAIGNLPEGWRPVQGVHLQLRNGRHRLYFWAHGKGVVRYLAAESDDGRRYRVMDPLRPCLYHPGDRTVSGEAAAASGLSRLAKKQAKPEPNEPLAPASLITNDATNVYQLPDGSFELFTAALQEVNPSGPRSIAHDNLAGRIRVIDRFRSADGMRWEDRRRVIEPDDRDPVDQQFYYLSVTHTEQGRIGILGHYRAEAQTMDLEWCFSEDGLHWQRPSRTPWLPRSAPGTLPDSYGVYAPHNLVQHGGEWHLFYTGTNDAHNHNTSHGPATRVVMHTTLASIR